GGGGFDAGAGGGVEVLGLCRGLLGGRSDGGRRGKGGGELAAGKFHAAYL
ncbi:MAG: hypothetical protein JST11_30945, partial [Acidobacteria bacterium]|nr:hypothetical protein [Acidobacteriota bacterium]